MLHLAFALPDSTALSFGSSKLFQILMPLSVYILFQELPGVRQSVQRFILLLKPDANLDSYEYLISLFLGFISWKIGCDFGFLIVATGSAPWSIAFTVAGLIPYAIAQYFCYYLIGQKMIIQGNPNPFNEKFTAKKITGRPPLWKRFVSKFFHENMNVTTASVPLRQVILKPMVDYAGIIISWPLYNVGLIFLQSGEINFAPLFHFMFLSIFVFYVVNVFGYILGYNLGEFLYFRLVLGVEWLKKQLRKRKLQGQQARLESLDNQGQAKGAWMVKIALFNDVVLLPYRSFCNRYGINLRWLMSASLGVACVIVIEPKMSSTIFSLANSVQHLWFYSFGHVDPSHVDQLLSAAGEGYLPPAENLTTEFARNFPTLYAAVQHGAAQNPGFEPSTQIALIAP
ncbi:hypothetical protein [Prochlorothrix hollandica]|uniref:Uncharacterized protein n=1 Tax=Prochlorothrix hollandica PCC 9006 = CALU 1027 TaxID=317619 RepID=A0A0M2Q274_PROHO|nr:hypothetical protein [Prochlorothrix hollandica]KKJ00722.1 hypothetical protein PROH_05470 [Prochlorothrix hollandica PCC 9006 = CALU 1027]